MTPRAVIGLGDELESRRRGRTVECFGIRLECVRLGSVNACAFSVLSPERRPSTRQDFWKRRWRHGRAGQLRAAFAAIHALGEAELATARERP